jgi:hypothetical protein
MVLLYEKVVQKLSSTEENGKDYIMNNQPQENVQWMHS